MTYEEYLERDERCKTWLIQKINKGNKYTSATASTGRYDWYDVSATVDGETDVYEIKARDEAHDTPNHNNIVDKQKIDTFKRCEDNYRKGYLLTLYNDGYYFINDMTEEPLFIGEPQEGNQWHGKKQYINYQKGKPHKLSVAEYAYIYGITPTVCYNRCDENSNSW